MRTKIRKHKNFFFCKEEILKVTKTTSCKLKSVNRFIYRTLEGNKTFDCKKYTFDNKRTTIRKNKEMLKNFER